MSPALFVLWSIVGWCGTPPPPPPFPVPFPRWLGSRVLGVAGGIAGGWLFNSAWPIDASVGVGLGVAATAVGAWFGSLFVKDVLGQFMGSPVPEPPN